MDNGDAAQHITDERDPQQDPERRWGLAPPPRCFPAGPRRSRSSRARDRARGAEIPARAARAEPREQPRGHPDRHADGPEETRVESHSATASDRRPEEPNAEALPDSALPRHPEGGFLPDLADDNADDVAKDATPASPTAEVDHYVQLYYRSLIDQGLAASLDFSGPIDAGPYYRSIIDQGLSACLERIARERSANPDDSVTTTANDEPASARSQAPSQASAP